MKRIITITAIISVVLFSCEKANEENMQDELQNQKSSVQSEMSELEISINNFLEKMESEEEGSLPLDSAVYFLEAGFNYRYANSGRDEELVATQVDTTFVDIQTNSENMCTYSSMNESYNNVYQVMESIYNNLSYEGKALDIVDIEFAEEEDGFQLRLISFFRYSFTPLSGDWSWGLDGGKCDGTFQGILDATDAIERRYELTTSPFPYGIWHNIDMTIYYGAIHPLMTQNAPSNPFGYYDSWLFYYSKDPGSSVCLLHDEINFYVDKVPEVIDRIKNNENINTTVKNIDIESDLSVNNSPYIILHRARLVYGRFESQRIMIGSNDFISI